MPIDILDFLRNEVKDAVKRLYDKDMEAMDIPINPTRKDFEGELSVVAFALTRYSGKNPLMTAGEIGENLKKERGFVEDFNVIKGFLNIKFSAQFWLETLEKQNTSKAFPGIQSEKVLLEYCGPNTNKPLHLGHIRNMVIGYSMAEILKEAGHDLVRANIYNDRGIAICKSMLAWKKWGNGETPESSGIKGDFLVGKYYILFDTYYKEELAKLTAKGMSDDEAKNASELMKEAREMLLAWEADDKEVKDLWRTMNSWVYQGFAKTFKRLGVKFEANYYESETYHLGKDLVEEGLSSGKFYQKDDGSIWVDLEADGLDQKVLIRSDGTSVYLTQDLGTADLRYQDYSMNKSVYVVADEQNYHFQVLKSTLLKLEKPYAPGIYHLSYGMVDLPSGKMKSREGTTVEADDLMREMYETAKQQTLELGKVDDFTAEEADKLYNQIGLAALKFHLLKVQPKRRILFNPEESVQFQGDTGPFVQYTFARIQSILRKAGAFSFDPQSSLQPADIEKELTRLLDGYERVIAESANEYDPSQVCNYLLSIAKTFNRFYAECPILKSQDPEKAYRLTLASHTAKVIEKGMRCLGIEVPSRM